jgi:hypothetical protein
LDSARPAFSPARARPSIGVLETPQPGYQLFVGTTNPGASNVYKSAWLTTTSVTVNNVIPTSGNNLYVRLSYRIQGVWSYIDYLVLESGLPQAPSMISPAPNSMLGSSSQTFTWNPGTASTGFRLKVGTTGRGSSDAFDSLYTTSTSVTVPSVPVSVLGSPLDRSRSVLK